MLGAAVLPAFAAKPATVPGPVEYGPWTLNAPTEIDFTCGGSYVHTLDTVVEEGAGDISGTGHYNLVPAYTWDMTGNVTGEDVTLQIVYNNLGAGTTYNLVGTINTADGSISGTVDSNCQSFEMPADTATRTSTQFTGNHGLYVSSQENKQEAAQSRVGMPVQSKGHTKNL
jgi:hypothetical protein